MEAVIGLLEGLTVWHWLGIGIVLLTLEVAVGTFDLLWIAMGAFATALFALIVPDPVGGWQGQLTFFGLMALVFVISGRTLFKGLRRRATTHPNLNDRLANMVGQRGKAATNFDGGRGKVKIGDSVWLAQQADDAVIVEGDQIVIAGAEGTTLKVKLA
ncbi:MAG: NfeD family protein [Hyphomonadaceae bacterium]|nr:NfeD family protein [Hyphomonadaceae bacterium]